MPIDAPVIAQLSKELNHYLPVRIDQVFQPYPDEFLFCGFGSGESFKLLVSLNAQYCRLHLFEGKKENPATLSSFCIALRKHFSGSKLTSIKAVPFERIIQFTFEVYHIATGVSQKTIWIELTAKSSNLIFTDANGKIIDFWRKNNQQKPGERELAHGNKYELPGTGGRWRPVTISWPQFNAIVNQVPAGITLEKLLLKHWYGLSPLSICEITRKAGFTPLTLCEQMPEAGLLSLFKSFSAWTEMVANQDFEPSCLYDSSGKVIDCSAFSILFPPEDTTVKSVPTLNRAVAEIYNQRHEVDRFKEVKRNLLQKINSQLEKTRHKLFKQEEEAVAAEQSDQFRIAGELLTTYGYQITKGNLQAVLVNHYDPEGKELTIPLNPALTPQANAQAYFKKYQKARKGQLAIATQIAKTKETVDYLESIEVLAQTALNVPDLQLVLEELQQNEGNKKHFPKTVKKNQKKEAPAEPHKFATATGHTILVGRNNLQNDRLTFKIAEPADWWFHTQKIPGSHVILRPKPGIPIDDESLNYACQLAAYFSKARQSTKIPVDYTQRKNVKKPPASKPGYVIYDFFKTAIITPDFDLLEKLGVPRPG